MRAHDLGSMRQHRVILLLALIGFALPAGAGESEFGQFTTKYTLTGSYAAAIRLENPDDGIINAPGDPRIPVAEDLKFPQSNNFDDGDRNFRKGDLVNNRASLLGDIEVNWRNFGVLLRGDAFYDDVYHRKNAHNAPDRINTTQEPFNSFTGEAEKFSGKRARLLDAYAYASFDLYDRPLQIRAGSHIAAWGQSLFFYGVALSQSSADATRATVPGSDVKSILLPSNQISLRFSPTDQLTLLAQYHLEFKPFEINPIGEFYSVTDLVGPGREFAYGFKNPFFLDNLGGFDITDPQDLAQIVMTIDEVLDGQLQTEALTAYLQSLPIGLLPTVSLPGTSGQNPLNAPPGLNPTYAGEIKPKGQQFGLGATYAPTDTSELGAFYLRYHQKTPVVQLNFGKLTVIPARELAPGVTIPALTTAELGLSVPETYNISYFGNVDLYAVSFSTLLFGWNVGGEVIRREGVDVLIDVDEGVNGIIPQSSRANTHQVALNAIYTGRPLYYFDTMILVTELGWIRADDIEGVQSHEGARAGQTFTNLTADKEAMAIAFLSYWDKSNVFNGWDLRIPLSYQQALKGRSPLAAGFGSLFDENDIRVGIGAEFTRLQTLTLGLNYSGFIGGKAHFFDRPLQDRDTIGVIARYNFF